VRQVYIPNNSLEPTANRPTLFRQEKQSRRGTIIVAPSGDAVFHPVLTVAALIVAYSYRPNVTHTPPAPRLRLLLVVVSFPFSFQFFTRLAAVFAEV